MAQPQAPSWQRFNDLIEFRALLAPMVGLSHVALRDALRPYFPKDVKTLWATEMLNSRRLPDQVLGETPETFKSESDYGLYPQILCNEERYIEKAIPKLEAWGASAIDINMGCPVKKALKHNYGVSLMGDTKYAASVVEMVKKHATVPVSVKLRAGHQNDKSFLLDFCSALKEAGADWLILHPRIAAQKRKGVADWEQIKFLQESIDLPIIGNGDIQDHGDIAQMLNETGCQAVMLGRSLTAKPWLITQFASDQGYELDEFQNQFLSEDPHLHARYYGEFVKAYINACFKYYEPKAALKRIRFFLKVGHVWLNFGHSFTKKLFGLESAQAYSDAIDLYMDNSSLKISKRTNLRY
ncbi:tRNA-dihydrouridine synthase family protein [Halobacteriovorax sp. HFRX-2_2]|uniref:tRNA-dihydrouridine synthase family protein n=1 Tax=unclassified Halobacteriovorax TaxID=2639665 RepID=UPI00371E1ABC